MTSLAFIFGILPLTWASGAGSASRNSLGTAVFGGMVVSTALNLFFVPVIYVAVGALRERVGRRGAPPEAGAPPRLARRQSSSKPCKLVERNRHMRGSYDVVRPIGMYGGTKVRIATTGRCRILGSPFSRARS